MSDLPTTPIEFSYTPIGGEARSLGRGLIDADGIITVESAAKGKEAFLSGIVAELNARGDVVLKEPPPSGGARFSVHKTRVDRGSDAFLPALKTYAARLYNLTLVFDIAAIGPAPADNPEPVVAADIGDGRDPDDIRVGPEDDDVDDGYEAIPSNP